MTLQELLAQAQNQLLTADVAYGHGTANAHDEAVWLVLWSLGLPLDSDTQSLAQQAVTPEQAEQALALVQQRISTRKPAAYLTQEAWLQGVPFYVDERVIVPRSFIAEMIANAPEADSLDDWLSEHTQRVLNLCTGNGSLAVLAAMAWPEVQVDAADISADALAVAQININRHDLQDRIRLVQSDGWQQLPERYDLVLCNPPYVSRHSMDILPAEYRAEPRISLDGGLQGGADGMDFIRDFLAQATQHLHPHGVVVLEIGNEREHFERAFPNLPCEWPATSAGVGPLVLISAEALQWWQSAPDLGLAT
jgi:ribosomal protein L3 glutamine methyltransferase